MVSPCSSVEYRSHITATHVVAAMNSHMVLWGEPERVYIVVVMVAEKDRPWQSGPRLGFSKAGGDLLAVMYKPGPMAIWGFQLLMQCISYKKNWDKCPLP